MLTEEMKKEKDFSKVSEGTKAIDALYEALEEEGILVSGEEKGLKDRVVKLEHEVALLKELVSGAIHSKASSKKPVLQD